MRKSARAKAYRRAAAAERDSDQTLPWRVWFYVVLGLGALAAPAAAFGGSLESSPWLRVLVASIVLAVGVLDSVVHARRRHARA